MSNQKSIFKDQAFINGKWVYASSGKTMQVFNPANEELIGTVPDMDETDTRLAIEAAHTAFLTWSQLTARERDKVLKQWARLIVENVDALASILTAEQGKPTVDARNEILFAASFVDWFAEEGKRAYGEIIPAQHPDMRYMVTKEPVGVCAGITPWNLPCAMVTRKAAPALAAGCTMVLKPAELTPFTALALADLAHQAGIPAGVFNVVTTSRANADAVGTELTSNSKVAKLSFTGSTRVGKHLISRCANSVMRTSMELGGNSPFIVLKDADLDVAVQAAMFSKFRNAGQTCIAPNRFYVHASLFDAFAEKLSSAARRLKLGNGADPDTTLGPLVSADAADKVQAHVDDAVAQGAKVILGGLKPKGKGHFYPATILTGVTQKMLMSREETFGPVIGIATYESDEELLEQVNETRYGLAAYLFGQNATSLQRITRKLEAGIVGVNTGMIATEVAPFGGYKESGLGREGARQGLDEFLETKFVCEAFPN